MAHFLWIPPNEATKKCTFLKVPMIFAPPRRRRQKFLRGLGFQVHQTSFPHTRVDFFYSCANTKKVPLLAVFTSRKSGIFSIFLEVGLFKGTFRGTFFPFGTAVSLLVPEMPENAEQPPLDHVADPMFTGLRFEHSIFNLNSQAQLSSGLHFFVFYLSTTLSLHSYLACLKGT